uniref:Putative lectin/glucanase superfamily protein n=1 Tax=viral metagenome TaxID=1070528 RepID=A0A6M3IFF3_9ZZZZ
MIKKLIIFGLLLVAVPGLCADLPNTQDDPVQDKQIPFAGAWLPNVDPAKIGEENFKELQNYRYTDTGIAGVSGYTKVNSTALNSIEEVFTEYTEQDAPNRLTVGSNYIRVDDLDMDEEVYIYKDFGENFFGDNFIIDFYIKNSTVGSLTTGSEAYLMVLANSIDDGYALENGSADAIYLKARFIVSTDTFFYLSIGESHNGYTTVTNIGRWVYTTELYFRLKNSNGYLTLKAYSDSARTQEFTAFAVTGFNRSGSDKFRYLFPVSAKNTGTGGFKYSALVKWTYIVPSIQNGHQLQTDFTTKSRVLVDTPNAVYQNTTAIPSRGDFATYSLYTKATGAGTGMFSEFPGNQVGYANEKESCIWAGDEMRPGGFFVLNMLAESYTSPLTFTTTQIQFPAATTLITDGYEPGMSVKISGSASNEKIISILSLSETVLTPTTALTAESVSGGITLTALHPANNVIDFTEAVQNQLKLGGNSVTIGGGIDSDTVLMLHTDGTEASTTITDSSATAHSSYTLTGGYLDSSVKKFGSASLKFTATSSYLDYSDCSHWYMGTGNFTIDFWVRFNSVSPGTTYLFSQYDDDDNEVSFYYNGSSYLYFISDSASVSQWAIGHPFTHVVSQWYHIEVSRINLTTLVFWVNGEEIGRNTLTGTEVWPDLNGNFEINARNKTGGAVANYDEFRVSKGVARHTSNFPVSSRAYASAFSDFLILTERPLQGIKPYVSEANTYSSTITGKYWTGGEFSNLSLTDGTTSAGVALAQTGSISFSSTVADAKPYHFQSAYLYAYLFSLSAGSADIYFLTVDAPFQPINDIWDGVHRTCVNLQVYDADGKNYKDYTQEANYPSTSAGTFGVPLSGFTSGSDHIIAQFIDRTTAIRIAVANSESNTHTAYPIIQYYTGSGWANVSNLRDTTTSSDENWNTIGQTGVWSWTPPEINEEQTFTLFGRTAYSYSITFSGDVSSSTTIDTVYGIPAQLPVYPFSFPSQYKGRAFLANFKDGKDQGRVDYSQTDSPNVWNGYETSDGGYQSIFFPGGLTAGTQLYNRYASTIYTVWVALAKNKTSILNGSGPEDYRLYPVSDSIGCPAALTLAKAEIGFKVGDDTAKNILLWVSYSGPVIFDGAVLYQLRGIENYFNPSNSEYINTGLISLARGWYDTTHDEYNILIPSGSSATENNTWLVYSLRYLKWYKKVPYSTYPSSIWSVIDTNGFKYGYAGTNDGYMLRLEYDTEWNDKPIVHMVETGDFYPTKNIWDITRLRRLKVVSETISEDADVAITYYTNTNATGKALTVHPLNAGSSRINRTTQPINELAWSHRLQYSVTMGSGSNAAEGDPKLLMWGYQYSVERKDE